MKKMLLILLVLFSMSISFGETPIEVDPDMYEKEIEKYVVEYNLDASLIQGRMYLYDEWIIYVDEDGCFHKFNTKTKKDILLNDSVDIDDGSFYIYNGMIYFRSGSKYDEFYKVIEMKLNGDYTCLSEQWSRNLEFHDGKLYFATEYLYEYDLNDRKANKISKDYVIACSMLKSGILYYRNEKDSFFRDWNGNVKELNSFGQSNAISHNKDDFLFIRNDQMFIGNIITNEVKETAIRDANYFYSYSEPSINLEWPSSVHGYINFIHHQNEVLVYEENGVPFRFGELYHKSLENNQSNMFNNGEYFVYLNDAKNTICSFNIKTYMKNEYIIEDLVYNIVGIDDTNIYYYDGYNIKFIDFEGKQRGTFRKNIQSEYNVMDGYFINYEKSKICISQANSEITSLDVYSDTKNKELFSGYNSKFEYVYSDKHDLFFMYEGYCYKFDKKINELIPLLNERIIDIVVTPRYIVTKKEEEKNNVSIFDRETMNLKHVFTINNYYRMNFSVYDEDLYFLKENDIIAKKSLITLKEEDFFTSIYTIDEIEIVNDIMHVFTRFDTHTEIDLIENKIKHRPDYKIETPLFFNNNSYIYSYVDAPFKYEYLIYIDNYMVESEYTNDYRYFQAGFFDKVLFDAIYSIVSIDPYNDVNLEYNTEDIPKKKDLAYYLWGILRSYGNMSISGANSEISDINISDSNYDEIVKIVNGRILHLDSRDNFYPNHNVTQKTCVASLIKLINLVRKEDNILVDINKKAIELGFIDNNESLSDNVITYRELYLYLEKAIEILTKDYYKIK